MKRKMIQVVEIGKAFKTVRAVDGVSFEVNEGEVFALLGPNGAGKSTLVRMMIGMLQPDQGVIQWYDQQGKPCSLDASQIGYLPEDRGLYRDQKVGRILEYFGQLRGMTVAESRKAASEWAERLEVKQYLNAKLETLSKGNQQKVQVAAALLHRPRLAFLDEPFSGLDPINQEMMLDVIRTLRDEGTKILLSAHQLELVERLADRVFLISHGKRVIAGTVPELKGSEFGGYTLQVHFSTSVSLNDFADWLDHPSVVRIDQLQDDGLEFTLKRREDAAEWLSRASEAGEIIDFRGGYPSLHEIYLRAVQVRKKPDQKTLLHA